MILTDDFVYIHMPKTAGTFVTHILARVFGEDRLRSHHLHGTCSDIPPEYAGLPIISTLRNPYERYVSQYRFGWWQMHPQMFCGEAEMRRMFPHYPELSFAEYLELANAGFVGWHHGQPNGLENHRFPPERRLGWHTEQFVRFYFRNPREVFARIDEDYIDDERFRHDLFAVRFLRLGRVNRELYEFLAETGHPGRDLEFILSAAKVFPAEGGRPPEDRWQAYYTPQLMDFVRTRERLLFKIFPEFDRGEDPLVA
ncbi:MAG: sulfotransferase family protein [bacterium]|nr:sulfotransferase family protein [bacterium]